MLQHDLLGRFFEEGIPFNRHIGVKVVRIEAGFCRLRVPARPDVLTGNPILPALHGGVMSGVADAAGGLAVMTELDDSQSCSTVDLRVDFLRRGDPSEDLFCEARVVRAGNRVAVTDCVLTQGERVVATARAVYNVVNKALGR